jgi:hypothetical protein
MGMKMEYEIDCLGKYLTGWVFYRKYILETERYKKTPVVLRSAYIDDPLRDYVADKPDQKQLLEMLEKDNCLFTKADTDDSVLLRITSMLKERRR